MRVRLGELKRLLRERVEANRARVMANQVATVAQSFVDSVVTGRPDGKAGKELQHQADVIASYAKFLITHQEPKGDTIGMVAMYAKQMADMADFWQRPMMLGRRDYVEKLQALLQKIQRFQAEA